MTSLPMTTQNINGKLLNQWCSAVAQREASPAPLDCHPGSLHTVNSTHPLGSAADMHVSQVSVVAPRKADAYVLSQLSGHAKPSSRLRMTDRTVQQPALTARPTTTFDAYCAAHVTRAAHPAARLDTPIGSARSVQLEGLTAEELERVSRFGMLPDSGPSKMREVFGAGDLLS